MASRTSVTYSRTRVRSGAGLNACGARACWAGFTCWASRGLRGRALYLLLPRLSAPLPRPGAPGAPALPPAPAGAPGPICFVKPYRGTEESECSGVTPEQYIIKQRDWTRVWNLIVTFRLKLRGPDHACLTQSRTNPTIGRGGDNKQKRIPCIRAGPSPPSTLPVSAPACMCHVRVTRRSSCSCGVGTACGGKRQLYRRHAHSRRLHACLIPPSPTRRATVGRASSVEVRNAAARLLSGRLFAAGGVVGVA